MTACFKAVFKTVYHTIAAEADRYHGFRMLFTVEFDLAPSVRGAVFEILRIMGQNINDFFGPWAVSQQRIRETASHHPPTSAC